MVDALCVQDLTKIIDMHVYGERATTAAPLERLQYSEPDGKTSGDRCHVSRCTGATVQEDDMRAGRAVTAYLDHRTSARGTCAPDTSLDGDVE